MNKIFSSTHQFHTSPTFRLVSADNDSSKLVSHTGSMLCVCLFSLMYNFIIFLQFIKDNEMSEYT